ncbi:MAG: nucleotidyltransferase domain-containing protein [Deltaproteobacteria bacterium]|nr:nucleotidyltransferase domain-containing protein [Deltaproteobacteria bacterium]
MLHGNRLLGVEGWVSRLSRLSSFRVRFRALRDPAEEKERGKMIRPEKMLSTGADRVALTETLRGLADRYAGVAQEVLGDNLTSVVLFGSVARGEAGPRSDVDLLVVCRDLPRGAFRRREALGPIRERLQEDLDRLWAEGITTDVIEVIKTEAEARRTHLLYLDMTEEAVLLFDRDGFFGDVLAGLRRRLTELGAVRRRLGDVRYWDLKPDFKPGEVIEL